MKAYLMPAEFDGGKFAARYGLDSMKDFWIIGGLLYVPETLPDDPPIFEAPDPPKPSVMSRIESLPGNINAELKQILLDLARGR